VAKAKNGKVYTWGWGERGQLGHRNDLNYSAPAKVFFNANLNSTAIINVQAGYRSSYCLLESRKLMWWGSHGAGRKQLQPAEYSNPDDEIYTMKGDFKPFKIVAAWSKTISVVSLLMADVRYLHQKSASMVEVLLKAAYKETEYNYTESKEYLMRSKPALLDQDKPHDPGPEDRRPRAS
jgi:alpha-tubulin suppressor-like RCC1 family protein